MKIVFLDAFTVDPGGKMLEPLSELGDLVIYDYTPYDKIAERASDAEILIVNKCSIDAGVIPFLKKLKFVCVAATGYNNVDIALLKQRQIPVSNVRGYSSYSVAQMVFASLLAVRNKVEYYFGETKKGRWCETPHFSFYDHDIIEFAGEVFGIVGYGDIGRKVATIADAMGCKVVVNTAHPELYHSEPFDFVQFDELVSTSDIISLHCPLTSETADLINHRVLTKMKPTATLINTSRGGLINENSLYMHLRDNPDFTAILDVLSTEPPSDMNPLLYLSNCFITPHQAWTGKKSRARLIESIGSNIQGFISGRLQNIVN